MERSQCFSLIPDKLSWNSVQMNDILYNKVNKIDNKIILFKSWVYDVVLLHSKPAKLLMRMNRNQILNFSVPFLKISCLKIQENWRVLCACPSSKLSHLIGWHLRSSRVPREPSCLSMGYRYYEVVNGPGYVVRLLRNSV